LNLCWKGYLGLYNKPKATVHPRQNADGPWIIIINNGFHCADIHESYIHSAKFLDSS
jgi:hypothetical protein